MPANLALVWDDFEKNIFWFGVIIVEAKEGLKLFLG